MPPDMDPRAGREIARYGLLDRPPGHELHSLVELAALIAGVPRAAINIITGTHQHQVATTGVEPSVCTREDSMCAAVLEEKRAVVVADASRDARFEANPFVTGEIGAVRFYASAPLVTRDGVALGRLCVFDDEPRELDAEHGHALEVVAERVVDVLELRLRSEELEASLHELTRTRDELRRSNEQLAGFAGQVSHDLRTPLTAMLLNTELASMDPVVAGDPEVSRLLSTALGAGQRMSQLIDDVLAFAHVGGELSMATVDLDALVHDVLADLGPSVEASGAAVELAGALGSVVGDRQQLYSVVLNLVGNAVKFSRPGEPPQICLRASRDAGRLLVEVSDRGVGIPPDQLDSVFDLFARADRSVPGSGIGLATVRAVVEAHGGEVGARVSDDEGTTFWFTLPVEVGEQA